MMKGFTVVMLVLGTLLVPVTEQAAPHPQPKSEAVPNITPDPKVNGRYLVYIDNFMIIELYIISNKK